MTNQHKEINHKTSITPPLLNKVPGPSQRSEKYMHTCDFCIEFACFYDFSMEYWNCSDSSVYFFVFHFTKWHWDRQYNGLSVIVETTRVDCILRHNKM